MKRILIILTIGLFVISCGEYQTVLNKGTNAERYQYAEKLYNDGDYKKAIPLFEKLVGPYAGKPQMERIQYMIADSYYNAGDYTLSSYYFSKFIANYPKSSKIEESAFLSAHSYYLASPRYSRDQKDTYQALEAFQSFIDTYPNSERVAEANKYYVELNEKLQKKDFEIAKQYYHTESFNSAITAFDIFIEEHIGSRFVEEAYFLKFKSEYELGVNSVLSKKTDRLNKAIEDYQKFLENYPESEFLKEADNLKKNLDKELILTESQIESVLTASE